MATIFTKIINGEIPSVKIHEDEHSFVILDTSPVNKGHALVIAKKEYETILECPEEELAYLMAVARHAAQKMTEALKIDGFNIMINNGHASGQEIPHLHIHIIPRYNDDKKTPKMLKETYNPDEIVKFGEQLRF